jgi:copper chaperone NosL
MKALFGLSRRSFSRRDFLIKTAAPVLLAALPAGCFGPDKSPREVKPGRDACAHCAMLLEDPRYAAQIQGGPRNERFIFDDVGCAVQYAAANPWARRPDAGFWAANYDNPAQWLAARGATYRDGFKTPMDLGFAAFPAGKGDYSFDRMTEAVVAKTGCAVVSDAPHTDGPNK